MGSKRLATFFLLAMACVAGGCLAPASPLGPVLRLLPAGCVEPHGVTLTAAGSGALFLSCFSGKSPAIQSAVIQSQAQLDAFYDTCVTPVGTVVNTTCDFNTQMMVGVNTFVGCGVAAAIPQACYFSDHIEVTLEYLTDESVVRCFQGTYEDLWVAIPTSNLPVDITTTSETL
jgi:hypothetical protein